MVNGTSHIPDGNTNLIDILPYDLYHQDRYRTGYSFRLIRQTKLGVKATSNQLDVGGSLLRQVLVWLRWKKHLLVSHIWRHSRDVPWNERTPVEEFLSCPLFLFRTHPRHDYFHKFTSIPRMISVCKRFHAYPSNCNCELSNILFQMFYFV